MTIVAIDGGRLNDDAAASYNRVRAAGMPGGVTSSYRSRAQQQHLYDLWRAGKGNFALPPGSSKHETGYSLDLPSGPREWLAKWGATYGWRRTNPKESWHFDYFPGEDQHRSNRDPGLTARTQAALRQEQDGYWGDGTEYALNLVRSALNGVYPNPVDLQHVVGVTDDGIVGPATKAAVIHTVADLQRAWGIGDDGIWGNQTEATWERVRAQNYKTW